MSDRTITALYQNRADAEHARDQLNAVGYDRVEIHDQGADSAAQHEGGFMGWVKDMFGGHEDSHVYGEGLRRGHFLLTAKVDELEETRAAEILESSDAVDLDTTQSSWRNEGWTAPGTDLGAASGYGIATSGGGMAQNLGQSADQAFTGTRDMSSEHRELADERRDLATDRGGLAGELDAGRRGHAGEFADDRRGLAGDMSGERRGFASDMADDRRALADDLAADRDLARGRVNEAGEQVIPVVEERLSVGKREVGRGGVRVRTYTLETPVREQVRLREEHVSVERRPVDRPVGAGDAAFQDREIELTESAEEAVISKSAVVKEELVLRKTESERVQDVDDTVRRTEVEVDDTTRGGDRTNPGVGDDRRRI